MSLRTLSKAIGFETSLAGKALSSALCGLSAERKKEISIRKRTGRYATATLFAVAATIGPVAAQAAGDPGFILDPKVLATPFAIISVSSGMALDVPSFSPNPATFIQQWPVNYFANQQWTFSRAVPDGSPYRWYQITSVSSGLVLDVPGFSTANGTKIWQWNRTGGTNQKWRFYRAPGSTGYEIIARDQELKNFGYFAGYVNLVLDVPAFSPYAATQIQQWEENGYTNQQWLPHQLASGHMFLSGSGNAITVSGFGFWAGTQACPVFDSIFAAPCTTVQNDGSFSTTVNSFGLSTYSSALAGYVVVTLENGVGNVLAIDSVGGALQVSY